MNRIDKITDTPKDNQIFTPITYMNPSIYYTPIINPNLLIGGHSQLNLRNNHEFNFQEKPISKKNLKNNTSIEISLISLLNAISDSKEKNLNSDLNLKNEESNKNESYSSESEKQEDDYAMVELLTQKTKRNQKYCYACPHHNALHYAKGMCSNCYHSRGRKKKPWKCPHLNKFHYAHGLCQNCYQMKYMKKQNDGGAKVSQSGSGLDGDDFSNNSEIKEKNNSSIKKLKTDSNHNSKKY